MNQPIAHTPTASQPSGAQVIDRYHELSDLVQSIPDRGSGQDDATRIARQFVTREARLLDHGRFETWLEDLTPDAVVWVPLRWNSSPDTDQSLFLDDRRRIGERVAWRRDPSAWGQQPPSVCVRVVGGVEAWVEGDRMLVHSAFTLTEHRHGEVQYLSGHQIHELVGPEPRCRTKILLLPQLSLGIRNPSFLL